MIENHIRKLFPKYKSKRELKQEIKTMHIDMLYDLRLKSSIPKIEHLCFRRIRGLYTPEHMIERLMANDIAEALRINGYLSFSKEKQDSEHEVYYCELKIVVPERGEENEL